MSQIGLSWLTSCLLHLLRENSKDKSNVSVSKRACNLKSEIMKLV